MKAAMVMILRAVCAFETFLTQHRTYAMLACAYAAGVRMLLDALSSQAPREAWPILSGVELLDPDVREPLTRAAVLAKARARPSPDTPVHGLQSNSRKKKKNNNNAAVPEGATAAGPRDAEQDGFDAPRQPVARQARLAMARMRREGGSISRGGGECGGGSRGARASAAAGAGAGAGATQQEARQEWRGLSTAAGCDDVHILVGCVAIVVLYPLARNCAWRAADRACVRSLGETLY